MSDKCCSSKEKDRVEDRESTSCCSGDSKVEETTSCCSSNTKVVENTTSCCSSNKEGSTNQNTIIKGEKLNTVFTVWIAHHVV